MKSKIFEGKVMGDIIHAAQKHFHQDQEYLNFQILEEKKGLFGIGAYISAEVTLNIDPIEQGKKYLQTLLSDLQLTGAVTVEKNEKWTTFKLTSDNNGFLIGKNGKKLHSIQVLTQQVVNRYSSIPCKIIVDVDSYKKRQVQRLEFLARRVAKEVIKTKIAAKLDLMNAYERRIIHQTLSSWDQIQTTSKGEEPNRYLVIKYKTFKPTS